MLRLGVTDDPLMILLTSTKLHVYGRSIFLRVVFQLLFSYHVTWILVSLFFIMGWKESPLFMQMQCFCILGANASAALVSLSLIIGYDILLKIPVTVKENAWNLKSCGEKTFAKILRSCRIIKLFHVLAYVVMVMFASPGSHKSAPDDSTLWQPILFLMEAYLMEWKLWLMIVYCMSSFSCVYAFCVLLNTCNYTLCHIRFQYHILNCYVIRLAKMSVENIDRAGYQDEIYDNIVTVVRVHQQIKKVCNKLLTHADYGIIGLTFTVIEQFLCIIAFISFDIHPATNTSMIVSMIPVAIFIGKICSNGQQTKNESEKVYNNALECEWYKWNTKNRRAYLIFLTNNMKPMKLTRSGVLDIDHELFMFVSKTVYSLFTLFINLSGKEIKF